MMDHSVPWIGLEMRLDSLENIPDYELPAAYGWRYFKAGDECAWARIEISAGEFEGVDDALRGFRKYYPTDDQLDARMIFLTDGGAPFATATAWFSDDPGDRQGRLHWVGIDAEHQRRGLSYPLVSLTLRRMKALGHPSAYLTTQTASWPAIKVYHRFGFVPRLTGPEDARGWRIVSEKTGIDFTAALNEGSGR